MAVRKLSGSSGPSHRSGGGFGAYAAWVHMPRMAPHEPKGGMRAFWRRECRHGLCGAIGTCVSQHGSGGHVGGHVVGDLICRDPTTASAWWICRRIGRQGLMSSTSEVKRSAIRAWRPRRSSRREVAPPTTHGAAPSA
jgi:hypothetical protein